MGATMIVAGRLLPSGPVLRQQQRQSLPSRQPLLSRSTDEHVEFHESIQDGLATILQVEIAKRQLRERAAAAAEERKSLVEKLREELDLDLQQLQAGASDRLTRNYDAALENLTSSVDELSRVLEGQKADRKAGDLEFEDWKRDMVKKRSQGLFFKSLFQEKRGKPKRLVDSLDALAKPEVQESLRRINAQRKVAKSPDDLAFQRSMAIIYGLTAAVLCAGLLQGVLDSSHSRPWQLALYAVFGAAFGASSWLALRPPTQKQRR